MVFKFSIIAANANVEHEFYNKVDLNVVSTQFRSLSLVDPNKYMPNAYIIIVDDSINDEKFGKLMSMMTNCIGNTYIHIVVYMNAEQNFISDNISKTPYIIFDTQSPYDVFQHLSYLMEIIVQ